MMGFGIFDLDVPTTKTASALLCLSKDEVGGSPPPASTAADVWKPAPPGWFPTLLSTYSSTTIWGL